MAADWILRVAQTPQRLLLLFMLTSGILSALLVNDTTCLLLVPVVITVITRARLPLPPCLLALAMRANLENLATRIGHRSCLPFLPFTLSLARGALRRVLALCAAFAGNFTLLGSVPNIIVVESTRQHCEVGFWDYGEYGPPITLLTTVGGMLVLLTLHSP